jgi:uncharacterized membrane protein YphA (DoxX/SURF4 family)
MKRFLLHPWLTVRVQMVLGAVFIAAAAPKIADPPAFAKAIWAYRIFPAWSVHPAALVLPWLEMICGVALALGLKVRAATTWVALLLAAFILSLSVDLARGLPVDCGCFGAGEAPRSEAQRLASMRWDLLRDAGLLLLAAQALAASRENRARKITEKR